MGDGALPEALCTLLIPNQKDPPLWVKFQPVILCVIHVRVGTANPI